MEASGIKSKAGFGTGSAGLDAVLDGLREGDNVVWRISSVDEYRMVVRGLAREARRHGRPVRYYRFAQHPPLLDRDIDAELLETNPSRGFETFITEVHDAIRKDGIGGVHIFDVLSELSQTFFSDRMMGNFFKLTCPYLRELDTIAYFGINRAVHSYHAIEPIRQTTQVLLDLYTYRGETYVFPTKLQDREDQRLLQLHLIDESAGNAVPVTDSRTSTNVLNSTPWPGLPSASYRMIGIWDRTFMRAEEVANQGQEADPQERNAVFKEVLNLLGGSEDRMVALMAQYLNLEEVIRIWKRMIGTGMLGGKTVGMLLARAILQRSNPKWDEVLESHDSFFIGSDVFYTFLVENNCWWDRQRQKDPDHFLEGNKAVQERIKRGRFPDYILRRFRDMLEYFGPSPIIVRSSSLLEDAFGNAFAGKYESIFCVNAGSPEERLQEFLDAVRLIYAGTMSTEALLYRRNRGVLARDEQMALLVQRVSGNQHGDRFFPHIAGVGFSFNPYVWHHKIDAEAGLVRLVLGLGTRAVERSDDDYTRIVALNAPTLRPESSEDQVREHTQRKADTLNVETNRFEHSYVSDLVEEASIAPLGLFMERDRQAERAMGGVGSRPVWLVTFDRLLRNTTFVRDMREVLSTVEAAYGTPVDVEFTANFDSEEQYTIGVVQCRPLQIQEWGAEPKPPPGPSEADYLILGHGGVVGHGRELTIDRIVFVDPEAYARLPDPRRYDLGRILRRLMGGGRRPEPGSETRGETTLLIGPGRWATSTPSLGVPVRFRDISTASVIMEVDLMHDGLVPDLSLGTHVFHEMVELNMLYVAHFLGQEGNRFDLDELRALCRPASSEGEVPDDVVQAVRVGRPVDSGRTLILNASPRHQRCAVYWRDTAPGA